MNGKATLHKYEVLCSQVDRHGPFLIFSVAILIVSLNMKATCKPIIAHILWLGFSRSNH